MARYRDAKKLASLWAGWAFIAAISALSLALLVVSGAGSARSLGTIPPFHVRVQAVAKGLANQNFAFRFEVPSETVRAPSSQWSAWIAYGTPQAQATLKREPGITRSGLPAVVRLNVAGVTGLCTVDAELKFDETGETTNLHSELFGPLLGILIWRDANGRPHALTMADYNRRYWVALNGINLRPAERPKQLPIMDRFIGGDDDLINWREGLQNLARAGANVLMLPPSPYLRELLLKNGLRKTAWAVYVPPGGVLGLSPDISAAAIQNWARQQAAPFFKAGYSARDMALFGISDEPGWYYPASMRLLAANPAVLRQFRKYLEKQHLSPAELGAASWSEVNPIGQSVLLSPVTRSRLQSRRLFYWTTRFFAWLSARHYAQSARALETTFYPGLPVFTNWNFFSGRFYVPGPFGKNPDPGSPDAAMGAQDWFEFARQRGGTFLWTEDWFPDRLNYQWSFYCSKLRSAAEKAGLRFGGHIIVRAAGQSKGGLLQRALSIIGGGGKAIDYYVFGPAYNFPGNAYSDNPQMLAEIAHTNRIIAAAEDLLWPGRPPQPQVAILAPRSAVVWDLLDISDAARSPKIIDATNGNLNAHTVDYMAEVFDIYLALQHTDIPANFVDEDDLSPTGLKPYKVLYVTEPDIPIEGQRGIAQWVREGGTLVMVSGAGAKARYDEPSPILDGLAGIRAQPRPRLAVLSLPLLKPVGRINSSGGELTAFGARCTITPAGARVLLRFDDGAPAELEHDVQAGHVVFFAWFPGISYVHSKSGLPGGFPDGIRRLIVYPTSMARVRLLVNVDALMVETPVLLSPKGAAVVLLNWRGVSQPRLTINLRLPFATKNVSSMEHGKIGCERRGDAVSCVIGLDSADILTITP